MKNIYVYPIVCKLILSSIFYNVTSKFTWNVGHSVGCATTLHHRFYVLIDRLLIMATHIQTLH